jgi:hypothetical protein
MFLTEPLDLLLDSSQLFLFYDLVFEGFIFCDVPALNKGG